MSDKKAQKNGSLIPSEKSQLIKYSNVLISRGLDLAKAIEKRGSIDFQRDAETYYNQGVAWFNKGDNVRSIASCNKALNINPRYAAAYNLRGCAWHMEGYIDQSIADHNKALDINPRFFGAYLSRASAWSDKGDFDRAIADCTKAIEIDPKSDVPYYTRGFLYTKQGKYDHATSDFIKTIEIDPVIEINSKFCCVSKPRQRTYMVKKEKAIFDYIQIMPDQVKKLIALGLKKGFLTRDDVTDILPNDIRSSDQLDIIIILISKLHIGVKEKDKSKK